jgi:hypothetical protein
MPELGVRTTEGMFCQSSAAAVNSATTALQPSVSAFRHAEPSAPRRSVEASLVTRDAVDTD